MIVVKCPHCDDPVSLPVGVDRHARVMCPLCGVQFDLAVVLERLPPALIVVEPAVTAFHADATYGAGSAGPSGASVYPGLDDEDQPAFADAFVEEPMQEELRLQPAMSTATRAEKDFKLGAPARKGGKVGSITPRRGARSQRNEKSAVAEIVKVVGGGVLGLSIGQLILWWLPGDWKRDPFQLGPVITKSVPWLGPKIVPAAFHGKALARREPAANQVTDFQFDTAPPGSFGANGSGSLPQMEFAPGALGTTESPAGGTGRSTSANGGNNGRNQNAPSAEDTSAADDLLSIPLPGVEFSPSPEPANAPAPTASEQDSLVVPMIDLSAFPGASPASPAPAPPASSAPSPPSAVETAADPSATEKPVAETPPTTPTVPSPTTTTPAVTAAPVPRNLGLKGVPRSSPAEIAERMSLAATAIETLDAAASAASTERIQAIKDFYASFAKLGENLAHAEETAEGADIQRKAVGELLKQIGGDAQKSQFVAKAYQSWMVNPRPHAGVFLVGTVEAVEAREPYVAVRLLLDRDQRLTLVSARPQTAKLTPNTKILVLGSLVEEPEIQLHEYTAKNEPVVLEGLIESVAP
jgi:hypothetical protein